MAQIFSSRRPTNIDNRPSFRCQFRSSDDFCNTICQYRTISAAVAAANADPNANDYYDIEVAPGTYPGDDPANDDQGRSQKDGRARAAYSRFASSGSARGSATPAEMPNSRNSATISDSTALRY